MALPTNLKFIPNIVPGGFMTDAPYTTQFKDIADALNNTNTVVNNIEEIINIILGGLFTFESYRKVGTFKGVNFDNIGKPTGGNETLLKTRDGALALLWHDKGNAAPFYIGAAIAEPPYDTWTQIDGTNAGQITRISAVSTAGSNGYVFACVCPITNNIYFVEENNSGGAVGWRVTELTYGGDNTWSVGSNVTVTPTVGVSNLTTGGVAAIVAYEDYTKLLCDGLNSITKSLSTNRIGAVYRGTNGVLPATWTEQVWYSGISDDAGGATTRVAWSRGAQHKLIKMDGDYLLYLFELGDGASPAVYNLWYSLSSDKGETWDYLALAGPNQTIDIRTGSTQRTGHMLPVTATSQQPTTDFIFPAQTGIVSTARRNWGATYIPGTTKVAITYCGKCNDAFGVYYCEFDRLARNGRGGFTDSTDHVRLSTFGIERQATAIPIDALNRYGFWFHGQGLDVNAAGFQESLHTITAHRSEDPLTRASWTTDKYIYGSRTGPNLIGPVHMAISTGGVETVNGVQCLPMVIFKNDVNMDTFDDGSEIIFKLWPIAALASPF